MVFDIISPTVETVFWIPAVRPQNWLNMPCLDNMAGFRAPGMITQSKLVPAAIAPYPQQEEA